MWESRDREILGPLEMLMKRALIIMGLGLSVATLTACGGGSGGGSGSSGSSSSSTTATVSDPPSTPVDPGGGAGGTGGSGTITDPGGSGSGGGTTTDGGSGGSGGSSFPVVLPTSGDGGSSSGPAFNDPPSPGTAVPEPLTTTLALVALAGLGWRVTRRRA